MEWSGAALINRDGKLVGVGSLILNDAGGKGQPGNMFVPIDTLTPILADLLAQGRPSVQTGMIPDRIDREDSRQV
jgi:S1-C subfamily serine protease